MNIQALIGRFTRLGQESFLGIHADDNSYRFLLNGKDALVEVGGISHADVPSWHWIRSDGPIPSWQHGLVTQVLRNTPIAYGSSPLDPMNQAKLPQQPEAYDSVVSVRRKLLDPLNNALKIATRYTPNGIVEVTDDSADLIFAENRKLPFVYLDAIRNEATLAYGPMRPFSGANWRRFSDAIEEAGYTIRGPRA